MAVSSEREIEGEKWKKALQKLWEMGWCTQYAKSRRKCKVGRREAYKDQEQDPRNYGSNLIFQGESASSCHVLGRSRDPEGGEG